MTNIYSMQENNDLNSCMNAKLYLLSLQPQESESDNSFSDDTEYSENPMEIEGIHQQENINQDAVNNTNDNNINANLIHNNNNNNNNNNNVVIEEQYGVNNPNDNNINEDLIHDNEVFWIPKPIENIKEYLNNILEITINYIYSEILFKCENPKKYYMIQQKINNNILEELFSNNNMEYFKNLKVIYLKPTQNCTSKYFYGYDFISFNNKIFPQLERIMIYHQHFCYTKPSRFIGDLSLVTSDFSRSNLNPGLSNIENFFSNNPNTEIYLHNPKEKKIIQLEENCNKIIELEENHSMFTIQNHKEFSEEYFLNFPDQRPNSAPEKIPKIFSMACSIIKLKKNQ
jgi:hypothetical protein